eukprot:CAMPEP_0177507412 /NCGR_PEP_ID=MMETSP0369-20130122/40477_1 /TAXON_ID=447022 ORGANISM="Scrippsiella hangoei-like, Strain SHHI-4" /NCGR_SAMPLE_ID=MMETSP0369 /ASSEMBLY_ACC=CAM_ASM_000364 /LENGTH=149 /DNA_ID=CAMNT_0018985449 /DNA_START=363 /DNA_END=813 /DNA_ORIENTATION=+
MRSLGLLHLPVSNLAIRGARVVADGDELVQGKATIWQLQGIASHHAVEPHHLRPICRRLHRRILLQQSLHRSPQSPNGGCAGLDFESVHNATLLERQRRIGSVGGEWPEVAQRTAASNIAAPSGDAAINAQGSEGTSKRGSSTTKASPG